MFNYKKMLCCALSTAAVVSVAPVAANAEVGGTITRDARPINAVISAKKINLEGADRFDTANRIALAYFAATNKVDTVILVNSNAIADALAVAPYAKKLNAPVLLAKKDSITNSTQGVLKKLSPKNIVLVGGENSLSKNLEKTIAATGVKVERIQGADRSATSLEIAKKMAPAKEAMIVNGFKGLADAASAGAIAAKLNIPLILETNNVENYKKNMKDLNIEKTYLIGGTSTLPENFNGAIAGERIAGANRTETNLKLIQRFYEATPNVFIAKDGMGNPSQLIDSVTIGGIAGKLNMPILLTSTTNKLSAAQIKELKTKGANLMVGVGGGISNTGTQLRSEFPKATVLISEEKTEKPDVKPSTGGGGGGGSHSKPSQKEDTLHDLVKEEKSALEKALDGYATLEFKDDAHQLNLVIKKDNKKTIGELKTTIQNILADALKKNNANDVIVKTATVKLDATVDGMSITKGPKTWDVTEKTDAADVMKKAENKLDGYVEEAFNLKSAGATEEQKQKIELARTFYKNKDNKTFEEISSYLEKLGIKVDSTLNVILNKDEDNKKLNEEYTLNISFK